MIAKGMVMKPQFNAGDKVQTKYGDGVVVYKRMSPPSYCQAAMYSVCLDHLRDRDGYSGTVVLPGELQAFEG